MVVASKPMKAAKQNSSPMKGLPLVKASGEKECASMPWAPPFDRISTSRASTARYSTTTKPASTRAEKSICR